jgi:hypothetical protein
MYFHPYAYSHLPAYAYGYGRRSNAYSHFYTYAYSYSNTQSIFNPDSDFFTIGHTNVYSVSSPNPCLYFASARFFLLYN